MPDQALWLAVPLAIVVAGIAGGRLLNSWFRNRGARAIVCPENRQPGRRFGRCRACGPDRIRRAPPICGFRPAHAGRSERGADSSAFPKLKPRRTAAWSGTSWCGGTRGSHAHRAEDHSEKSNGPYKSPRSCCADKVSVEWSQVPAERLTETLQTALPVCFACHMANTLVRERPDLIIDRSRGITQRS